MKKIVKLIAVVLVLAVACPMLFACKKNRKTVFNNETDPLVLSSLDLDGVFNPFFATTGPDMEVVGLTQISMMTTDKNGELVCGDGLPTVAKDYYDDPKGSPNPSGYHNYDTYYTDFHFLIKNGLKFSDGSDLTVKDILFNLYVYLDPVYTGSTTMYSTDIKGLKAYRNQDAVGHDDSYYQGLEEGFRNDGRNRINTLINMTTGTPTGIIKSDSETVEKLFKEELENDWSVAASRVEDLQKEYPEITTTWMAYFEMYGYITLDTEKKTVKDWQDVKDFASKNNLTTDKQLKDACVKYIMDNMINYPKALGERETLSDNYKSYWESIEMILTMYATSQTALDYFIADAKSIYFDELKGEDGVLDVENISGITVQLVNEFKGKALDKPHYKLSIRINGVDPKAKYNFSFSVAPMKYYSSKALYDAAMADLELNPQNPADRHFGVDFSNPDFMFNVVRNGCEVPIGAGPYKASNSNNAETVNNKNQFMDGNVVYYVRNSNFMFPVTIKLLRYKVVSSAQLYNAVENEEIHFAMPNALNSTINKVINTSHLDYRTVENLGYGYVGINAKYVTDLRVRKAIMHAMDISMVVSDYYGQNLASNIYRPMSKASWAYPENCEVYYKFDETGALSEAALEGAYGKNSAGKLVDSNKKPLEYTFTIAGSDSDHPIVPVFNKAKAILEKIGFTITVKNDSNALRKLSSGLLAVWAAAWGSAVDPDMYQVYHKNSTATSVKNWGYESIFTAGTPKEQKLVNDLAYYIEEARHYLDNDDRKEYYSEALDIVMELAIELPTYQRKNLFIFNKNVIDVNTMSTELTAYQGPISEIWKLSLVTA